MYFVQLILYVIHIYFIIQNYTNIQIIQNENGQDTVFDKKIGYNISDGIRFFIVLVQYNNKVL